MTFTAPEPAPRREQILACSLELFGAHGMHGVTTRQIAAAVGISQPSLYAHFPTRDAIGVELCRRAFQRLHDCLVDAAAADGSPTERLGRLGRRYLEFGLGNEAAYRVAFMTPMSGDPGGKGEVLSSGLMAFGVMRDLLAELLGEDAPKAECRAQSYWASLHGLLALLLDRPEFPWIDRDELMGDHLDAITRAALHRGS